MKRVIALFLVVMTMFCFSGCDYIFGETNTLLKAPTPQGEFEDIGKAIKAANIAKNYTLKSARRGFYRSSFIIRDVNSDGIEDAIAFFSYEQQNTQELHMVMLNLVKDEWQIVSDTLLRGTDIEKVEFGDFDNNGTDEMVVATNIYGSPELRLSLYNISSTLPVELYEGAYSDFVITDMNKNDKDDLMIINVDSLENTATCKMLTLASGAIKQTSMVAINTAAVSVTNVHVSSVDGNKCLYIDAKTASNTYFTDLVYYKDGKLIAPIAKEVLTTRYENTTCSDIDGDGVLEIPTSTVLPGEQVNALSLTEWYNYSGLKFITRERSVVSKSGGYRLKIDDSWIGKFTCKATDFDGIDFYEYNEKVAKKLFSIKAVNKQKVEDGFNDWSIIDTSGEVVYILKIHKKGKLNISKSKIRKNTIVSTKE